MDDFQCESGFAGNTRAKLLAVLRRAARGGGNEPGALDATKVHFFPAHQQRFHRARDRRLADASGPRYAFAKPNDARECIDDAKTVRCGARHQKPAIIGAKIERRIGRRDMPRLRSTVAKIAPNTIWRPATPPRPSLGPSGGEAALRRCPVVHPMPSCRAGAAMKGSTVAVSCSNA